MKIPMWSIAVNLWHSYVVLRFTLWRITAPKIWKSAVTVRNQSAMVAFSRNFAAFHWSLRFFEGNQKRSHTNPYQNQAENEALGAKDTLRHDRLENN